MPLTIPYLQAVLLEKMPFPGGAPQMPGEGGGAWNCQSLKWQGLRHLRHLWRFEYVKVLPLLLVLHSTVPIATVLPPTEVDNIILVRDLYQPNG